MSYNLFLDDVLFYQRFLKSAGFYTGKLDGTWGPKTNGADNAFIKETMRIKEVYGSFDARSELNISTLLPKAQIAARSMLKGSLQKNRDVRIISGTRSYQEQNTIYRQGRYGNKSPKVTNAKGGQSNHNFGLAWDIGMFNKGAYLTETASYIALAKEILPNLKEVTWGGHWTSFKDYPHYQLRTATTQTSELKMLFEKGASLY